MAYRRFVEVQNMNKDNNKKNNPFKMETPLECIGFGFFIMLLLGGLWFFAIYGKTVEEFAWSMILVYGLLGGPFILYGILSLLGAFDFFGIKNVKMGCVTLAHYAAVFARLNRVNYKYSIVVFVATFVASTIFKHLTDKRKKDK